MFPNAVTGHCMRHPIVFKMSAYKLQIRHRALEDLCMFQVGLMIQVLNCICLNTVFFLLSPEIPSPGLLL